ncbi:DUF6875 domain-containing protein [Paraburkholderia metrosideri]|jgi:hypothetical protein|uniref:DUF6875 domain-containing protein n=1 Tax=Paraburkholderia metrosideri TaxID=580937 RepID=A0ABN7IB56_9BURK|nr:hypothetical protein [Paraburkholderia metrosideri]CAD6555361.1 hypothetical protein LMG28140_05671 [Paraburkholderia metrosideri]
MAIGLSASDSISFEEASIDGSFSRILRWIEDFLCAPNTELGRLGDVCPFAKTAVLKRSIEFYRNHSLSVACLSDDVELHRDEFLRSGGRDDIYRCRIIVPDSLDNASSAIESVQKQLKPKFVGNHLMLGQFFPDCEEPGLRNKMFRPLQTPVPLIAIRNMVPTDIAFLYGNEQYVSVYMEKFGSRGIVALRQFEATLETTK